MQKSHSMGVVALRCKKNIAILISGRGSNMSAILRASQSEDYPAQIRCIISNNTNAPGLIIAQSHNVVHYIVNHCNTSEIHHILSQHSIDLVCLAGFMKKIDSILTKKWKIINIHPSLLPSFPGLNAQQQALQHGAKITGCTVHWVNEEIDAGKIISQSAIDILESDTVESLSARLLVKEHELYVKTIQDIIDRDMV